MPEAASSAITSGRSDQGISTMAVAAGPRTRLERCLTIQLSRARVGSRSGSTDRSFRRQQDRFERVDASGGTVSMKARRTEKSPK